MEQQPQLNEHNKQEFPPAHTAEHILNQTMVRMFGCERSRHTHIERKKSKLDYQLPTCPTAEQVAEIERRVNEVIARDLPVTMDYMTQEEAVRLFDLGKLPEDASSTLRIVRVGDYDACPCIGTHVAHTAEIGRFRISSTRYADGVFRIVFRLDLPE
ncbi:hypothetical protein H6B14_03085 [Phocaeicola coprophilus]|nr:hypothetical protein [Phocaeicola coprophilus]